MAERESDMASRSNKSPAPQTEVEYLTGLFRQLGDEVLKLLEAKLGLAKVEIKEDAGAYARSAALAALGIAVGIIGFALVSFAAGCFAANLFGNDEPGAVLQRYGPTSYGLGFLLTGLLQLALGAIIFYAGKKRMTSLNPVPAQSIAELKKDQDWLKREV